MYVVAQRYLRVQINAKLFSKTCILKISRYVCTFKNKHSHPSTIHNTNRIGVTVTVGTTSTYPSTYHDYLYHFITITFGKR